MAYDHSSILANKEKYDSYFDNTVKNTVLHHLKSFFPFGYRTLLKGLMSNSGARGKLCGSQCYLWFFLTIPSLTKESSHE